MELLSIKDAAKLLSVSRSTLYRLLETPGFPQPVPVTDHHKGFLRSELEAWIARRAGMRRQAAA